MGRFDPFGKMPVAGGTFTGSVSPARVALTDAATIAINAALGNEFDVTLGGNRTLGEPTNPVDGKIINIRIKQDGTGTRTLAYNAIWKHPGGVAPVLSTAASAVDRLSAVYNLADNRWETTFAKGFA